MNQQTNIAEIDGPPMAFFESDGCRYIYRTFAFVAADGDYSAAFSLALRALRAVRTELAAEAARRCYRWPLIVWRQRPKFSEGVGNDSQIRMRLTTQPMLTKEAWARIDGVVALRSDSAASEELALAAP